MVGEFGRGVALGGGRRASGCVGGGGGGIWGRGGGGEAQAGRRHVFSSTIPEAVCFVLLRVRGGRHRPTEGCNWSIIMDTPNPPW